MSGFEAFIDTFFRPSVIATHWLAIAKGLLITIEIGVAVVLTGVALGLALAVLRAWRWRFVNALIVVFADVMRAIPPLVLVLLIYFGLPNVGLTLPAWAVLWVVLSLVLAAFAEEVFWAGILWVPAGQWDAARASGFRFWPIMRLVILPQAVKLAIPPLTSRTIAITKNTALGAVIGVPEIMNEATRIESFIGNATPLTMGAIAYLILFLPVVIAGRWVETRFRWRRA